MECVGAPLSWSYGPFLPFKSDFSDEAIPPIANEEITMTEKITAFIVLASLFVSSVLFRSQFAQEQILTSIESLPGLQRQVTLVRDTFGVPHITASGDRDIYFMMGYMHAEDRFFQMDVARRQGSGTLAELLGAGPNDALLGSDVNLRRFGVRRSAERSLNAYSPEAAALIQSYSDGVNTWLDSNPLPPEYATLEITQIPRWQPVDSIIIVKLLQFQLSFDTGDLARTAALSSYQAAGQARGFDGTRLFFEDVFTFAPFDPAVTIPSMERDASRSLQEIQSPNIQSQTIEKARQAQEMINPDVIEAARKFIEQYNRNPLLNRAELGIGSNWWVVAGSKTDTGNAMLANDPHLGLGIPSTFYEIHLRVDSHSSPMNVYGVSIPGIPGVILGQNEHASWGVTTAGLDLTDFFVERLVLENGVPSATRYEDGIEPLVVVTEEFKMNQVQNGVADDVTIISPGNRPSGVSVPPTTLIVPRRNNGALLGNNLTNGLSVQFVGSSATRDLEGLFALARARNLTDFKRGLQFLGGTSLNWAYADVNGNIAAFSNGNVPLREDLQAGTVDGLPPFFMRDGTGTLRNEWILKRDSRPGFNYESLPFEEMPQTVNPSQGFLVNANNDPIGVMLDNNPLNQMRSEGIYYISSGFSSGYRAAKIASLITQQLNNSRGNCKVSFQDMKRIQSNVQMFDAEVFTPHIIRAFDRARSAGAPAELAALANDPAVSEAVGRLPNWDFSTPTGISEGYDAGDRNGSYRRPSDHEVSNSIAATIYTVWRSRILANTIVATLQRVGLGGSQPGGDRMLVDLRFLLDNFSINQGLGASGLDFFEIPGGDAPPDIRRDTIILKSLKEALNLLASDAFAAAFGGSTNQNDYRWGKLHRITFGHLFGSMAPQFSIPPAGDLVDLSPTLPGLATDGGWETIDNAPFNLLAASSQAYTFGGGPARRYVSEMRRWGIKSVQIIPGGESGVVGNRFYADQVSLWLTNKYHDVFFSQGEINSNRFSKIVYKPAN
jgi:penicillin G amidase